MQRFWACKRCKSAGFVKKLRQIHGAKLMHAAPIVHISELLILNFALFLLAWMVQYVRAVIITVICRIGNIMSKYYVCLESSFEMVRFFSNYCYVIYFPLIFKLQTNNLHKKIWPPKRNNHPNPSFSLCLKEPLWSPKSQADCNYISGVFITRGVRLDVRLRSQV